MLRFQGAEHFRQRLVFSTLSGRPIRIDGIRPHAESPGLQEHEASLLRLIEKVTNGCIIEINETGTSLRYKPGFIHGGPGIEHDCGTSRGVGYYLEPLALLALFGRSPLSASLRGVTNGGPDPGVDVFRAVTLPLLRQLAGLEDGLELRIEARGAPPLGGGEVRLRLPCVKALPPVALTDEGMVRRVRGVAHSMRVSPQAANRLVDGARGVMNKLLADVFIFTDHMSGRASGLSPGYGVALVAETTSGRMLCAEACAELGKASQSTAEDVGRAAAAALLEEVSRGGVADSMHQALVLTLCALGPEEINEVRLGPLTPYAVGTLRHLRDFFNVQFSIRPEEETRTIFLSCVGAGVKNLSKKIA
ncbi:RNA 3'-terminal phosphate cyclase-like protein [Auxenochlorella protothecoides]|uniref:RNA 3'-terminal phosphate cyclase-like protein n=1 Tax=Auxenochlorella protothecoides TaxID=3075 RepID=A0A087SH10_AUXPR|nr:RNA 3'-terminal phosphate cyclase-like protein [Auxenochlorella protothecoides]KFM25014.1 RNA 3'-terminal phosphate cyclase-like protein [Auxenochlorella protothecoides]